ncbi:MAG: hypothetical protein AB8B99_15005 [Phormidesmis sp.]
MADFFRKLLSRLKLSWSKRDLHSVRSRQSSESLPRAHPLNPSHVTDEGSQNQDVRNETHQSEVLQLDAEAVEAEIRASRKFSLADAIGKEGGSFLRSGSTIPRPLQAANIITHFIQSHTSEPTGPFSTTLQLWSCQDIRLSRQLDKPLSALAEIIASLLDESTTFYEFARQIAIAHSNLTGDRPYFQAPNQPPHPDADYTHDAIRAELIRLQQQL